MNAKFGKLTFVLAFLFINMNFCLGVEYPHDYVGPKLDKEVTFDNCEGVIKETKERISGLNNLSRDIESKKLFIDKYQQLNRDYVSFAKDTVKRRLGMDSLPRNFRIKLRGGKFVLLKENPATNKFEYNEHLTKKYLSGETLQQFGQSTVDNKKLISDYKKELKDLKKISKNRPREEKKLINRLELAHIYKFIKTGKNEKYSYKIDGKEYSRKSNLHAKEIADALLQSGDEKVWQDILKRMLEKKNRNIFEELLRGRLKKLGKKKRAEVLKYLEGMMDKDPTLIDYLAKNFQTGGRFNNAMYGDKNPMIRGLLAAVAKKAAKYNRKIPYDASRNLSKHPAREDIKREMDTQSKMGSINICKEEDLKDKFDKHSKNYKYKVISNFLKGKGRTQHADVLYTDGFRDGLNKKHGQLTKRLDQRLVNIAKLKVEEASEIPSELIKKSKSGTLLQPGFRKRCAKIPRHIGKYEKIVQADFEKNKKAYNNKKPDSVENRRKKACALAEIKAIVDKMGPNQFTKEKCDDFNMKNETKKLVDKRLQKDRNGRPRYSDDEFMFWVRGHYNTMTGRKLEKVYSEAQAARAKKRELLAAANAYGKGNLDAVKSINNQLNRYIVQMEACASQYESQKGLLLSKAEDISEYDKASAMKKWWSQVSHGTRGSSKLEDTVSRSSGLNPICNEIGKLQFKGQKISDDMAAWIARCGRLAGLTKIRHWNKFIDYTKKASKKKLKEDGNTENEENCEMYKALRKYTVYKLFAQLASVGGKYQTGYRDSPIKDKKGNVLKGRKAMIAALKHAKCDDLVEDVNRLGYDHFVKPNRGADPVEKIEDDYKKNGIGKLKKKVQAKIDEYHRIFGPKGTFNEKILGDHKDFIAAMKKSIEDARKGRISASFLNHSDDRAIQSMRKVGKDGSDVDISSDEYKNFRDSLIEQFPQRYDSLFEDFEEGGDRSAKFALIKQRYAKHMANYWSNNIKNNKDAVKLWRYNKELFENYPHFVAGRRGKKETNLENYDRLLNEGKKYKNLSLDKSSAAKQLTGFGWTPDNVSKEYKLPTLIGPGERPDSWEKHRNVHDEYQGNVSVRIREICGKDKRKKGHLHPDKLCRPILSGKKYALALAKGLNPLDFKAKHKLYKEHKRRKTMLDETVLMASQPEVLKMMLNDPDPKTRLKTQKLAKMLCDRHDDKRVVDMQERIAKFGISAAIFTASLLTGTAGAAAPALKIFLATASMGLAAKDIADANENLKRAKKDAYAGVGGSHQKILELESARRTAIVNGVPTFITGGLTVLGQGAKIAHFKAMADAIEVGGWGLLDKIAGGASDVLTVTGLTKDFPELAKNAPAEMRAFIDRHGGPEKAYYALKKIFNTKTFNPRVTKKAQLMAKAYNLSPKQTTDFILKANENANKNKKELDCIALKKLLDKTTKL